MERNILEAYVANQENEKNNTVSESFSNLVLTERLINIAHSCELCWVMWVVMIMRCSTFSLGPAALKR